MRSGKLTNTLLALLAHLVAPLLAAKEAAPAGKLKLEADQRRREPL